MEFGHCLRNEAPQEVLKAQEVVDAAGLTVKPFLCGLGHLRGACLRHTGAKACIGEQHIESSGLGHCDAVVIVKLEVALDHVAKLAELAACAQAVEPRAAVVDAAHGAAEPRHLGHEEVVVYVPEEPRLVKVEEAMRARCRTVWG